MANNGLEVIEAVQRQPYDVILMDVHMPEIDGLEAARRIRALSTVVKQPWIVAVTADVMQEAVNDCEAAGMNNFISKPMTLDTLEATLGQIPMNADGVQIQKIPSV